MGLFAVIADSMTGDPIVTSGGTFGKAADLQLLYRMGSPWFVAANGTKNGKMAHPRVSWSCRNYELPRLSPSLKKSLPEKKPTNTVTNRCFSQDVRATATARLLSGESTVVATG